MKKWFVIIPLGVVAIIFALVWLQKPSVPDFTQYPAGEARKVAFFDYFLPLVQQENERLLARRAQIREWQQKDELGMWEQRKLDEWLTEYRLEDFDPNKDEDWQRLLRRVDIVPPSLALAQAANESAWGTSRFARKANNYFGQWCFVDGCGLVPRHRDDDADHEVAAFSTPAQSVSRYMRNLNRHNAYKGLRGIRARLRDQGQPVTGIALAEGLLRYSERGKEYVKELKAMIRYNELDQLDVAQGPSTDAS